MDALSWFESNALARHGSGPYLLGESFSMLDIMTISSMERLAAGEDIKCCALKGGRTSNWLDSAVSGCCACSRVCAVSKATALLWMAQSGMRCWL